MNCFQRLKLTRPRVLESTFSIGSCGRWRLKTTPPLVRLQMDETTFNPFDSRSPDV